MPSFAVEPIIKNEEGNVNGEFNKMYFSPGFSGEGTIYSVKKIWNNFLMTNPSPYYIGILDLKITIENNNSSKIICDYFDIKDANLINEYLTKEFITTVNNGRCSIIYEVAVYYGTSIPDYVKKFKVSYNLYITENTEPLPKWNAWTVCERMLNIAETIRQGDKPRFKLDKAKRRG